MRASMLSSTVSNTHLLWSKRNINVEPCQPAAWLMHCSQKWICDEAVMWWAAYTRNKLAPLHYCSSLCVHVSICMVTSHTGGCMWPWGLINDTYLSSLMSDFRACGGRMVKGVCSCCLVCIPAALLWCIHFPASLSVLWPGDSPIPSGLKPSHHCSSVYNFVVISYFDFYKVK